MCTHLTLHRMHKMNEWARVARIAKESKILHRWSISARHTNKILLDETSNKCWHRDNDNNSQSASQPAHLLLLNGFLSIRHTLLYEWYSTPKNYMEAHTIHNMLQSKYFSLLFFTSSSFLFLCRAHLKTNRNQINYLLCCVIFCNVNEINKYFSLHFFRKKSSEFVRFEFQHTIKFQTNSQSLHIKIV